MTIPAEQQPVADFLGAIAGQPPTETHISAVFVSTDTVWKLKKAVRLPFLDFTTLEARRHFLCRELEINKPAAPELYRDVIAISRGPNNALSLSDHDPIDYVLRMARIPEQDFLEYHVRHNNLGPELLDAIGDAIADYHDRLPSVPLHDHTASMLRIAQGNAVSALNAGLPKPAVDAWQNLIAARIQAARPWIDARVASGHVRRCHGDLHLGNICLWKGRPVPFDALEFDEALATIDVGYDLAFLLMDLDLRVNRAAANRVMNRYIARTGDAGLLAGMPFFRSQRAMIRAHVLTSMGQDGSAYLAAAQNDLQSAKSVVIAIGGLQGTGKSTIARALAPDIGAAPGALIVRSDEIRKRLHHQPPEARLPPEAYTQAANTATNKALVEQSRLAAAAGHAVIADATFLDPTVRHDLAATVASIGLTFIGIWLDAPLPALEARIAARAGDASDATIDVLRRSAQNNPGPGDWTVIDATDRSASIQSIRQRIAAG